MKKRIMLLAALIIFLFTACDDEATNSENDANTNGTTISEEQSEGSIITVSRSENTQEEVVEETIEDPTVTEVEFSSDEMENEFTDILVNEIGIEPIISDGDAIITDSLDSDTKASIKLKGNLKRKWYGTYCRYSAYSNAEKYTPRKINVTLKISGWKTVSKTAKNKRSVGRTEKEYRFPAVNTRQFRGVHECWYNFGSGYLKVNTKIG